MQYIDFIDYLLLPVYFFIFYLIVKKRSLKYTDIDMRKFMLMAFFLRMFGSATYCLMVQYYYGYGDSFIFYSGSNFLRDQVLQDPGNISYFFESGETVSKWYMYQVGDLNYAGYYGIDSNLFVMKISALLSFLAFNKYMIISLFFGFFSFAGQWKLFKVFCDINNNKHRKILAWAVLYTPSIWFWGSGLMKDSLCIGGLGYIIHILYKNFIKKEFSFREMGALVILVFIVGSIKSYIIIVLAVGLSTIIFSKLIKFFKNVMIRAMIILSFLLSTIIIAFITNFADQLQELAHESKVQVDSYQRNYEITQQEDESSEAGVKSDEIDASIGGMILHCPIAVFTCLFRPFIWESRKLIILFTSLESMLLLISTLYLLYKTRVYGFIKILFSNEYVLFSFVISMLFATIIGFTTYNFGTIVRYKIILLPFYYFMLLFIYIKYKESVPVVKAIKK